MQHISDMHSKFALRPHHVWKYGNFNFNFNFNFNDVDLRAPKS